LPREYLKQGKYCENCGIEKVLAKNRCTSCYKWLKYKGIERPRRLWDIDAKCKNSHCRRPLDRVKRRYKAFCKDCALYWALTGEYRPRKYCNRRWCDCGEVATQEAELVVGTVTKTGKIKRKKEKFWLCEKCYQMECANLTYL
jgi:hypothetical protein